MVDSRTNPGAVNVARGAAAAEEEEEEEEVVAAVVVNASAAEMPAIRRTSIAVGRDNNKGHKNSLFICPYLPV